MHSKYFNVHPTHIIITSKNILKPHRRIYYFDFNNYERSLAILEAIITSIDFAVFIIYGLEALREQLSHFRNVEYRDIERKV